MALTHALAVQRVRQPLAGEHVAEQLVVVPVHGQMEARPLGVADHGEVGVVLQPADVDVGRVDQRVDVAVLELGGPLALLGDDRPADAVEVGGALVLEERGVRAGVVGPAAHCHMAARLPLLMGERPSAVGELGAVGRLGVERAVGVEGAVLPGVDVEDAPVPGLVGSQGADPRVLHLHDDGVAVGLVGVDRSGQPGDEAESLHRAVELGHHLGVDGAAGVGELAVGNVEGVGHAVVGDREARGRTGERRRRTGSLDRMAS